MLTIVFDNGSALTAQTFAENQSGTVIVRGQNGQASYALDMTDVMLDPIGPVTELIDTLTDGRMQCSTIQDVNRDCEYDHLWGIRSEADSWLCFAGEGPVEHLVVLDSEFEEVAYWDCQEWQEDGPEVFGAIVGALLR